MRKNAFFGLLVILLLLSFTGCGGDDELEIYTVTIGTLINANGSTIIANPVSGVKGTEITLTITEDNTYRLKSGTLKYGTNEINENTLKFSLPAENITITAEFISILVGHWQSVENIHDKIIFFENGIYGYGEYNSYTEWGTWTPQSDNIIIINTTNNTFIGEPYDSTCEILTNKSIKILWFNDNENIENFILIE